jgi:hypothetical protein
MSDKKPAPEVPDHVIESFARCIFPAIQAYFESEEGQKEFAAWKDQKETEAGRKASKPH